MSKIRTTGIACVAALAGMIAIGCEQEGAKTSPPGDSPKTTAATHQPTAATPNTPPETKPAQSPPPPPTRYEAKAAPQNPAPDAVAQQSSSPESDPREMAADLIYAQIRIKMEEMIASRASMLKSGRNPSDVEVRQLEGSIMRARDLLMENGEKVEDVNPPIVGVGR